MLVLVVSQSILDLRFGILDWIIEELTLRMNPGAFYPECLRLKQVDNLLLVLILSHQFLGAFHSV